MDDGILLLLFAVKANSAPCTVALQREALAQVFEQTSGESWLRSSGWLDDSIPCSSGPPHCCWEGVKCCTSASCAVDAEDEIACNCTPGFVVALKLDHNKLEGNLPDSVAASCELRSLDLDTNELSGPMPETIRELGQLIYLFLGKNELTGELGDSLRGLTRLQALDLSGNRLEGAFPFQSLCGGPGGTSLHTLLISDNRFHGSIDLTPCRELMILDMPGNLFDGPLPDLRTNKMLHHLSMNSNGFIGSIPKSLASAKLLFSIDLSNNQLEGRLEDLDLQEKRLLRILRLNSNLLTGKLTASWLNVPQLNLSSNRLTGRLPSDSGAFAHLASHDHVVDLHENLLSCCGTGLQDSAVDLRARPREQLPVVYQGVDYSAPRLPPYLSFDNVLLDPDADGLQCPKLKSEHVISDHIHGDRGIAVEEWRLDPFYYLYDGCVCKQGFRVLNLTQPNKHPVITCELAPEPKPSEHFTEEHPWSIAIIVVGGGGILLALFLFIRSRVEPSLIQQFINMRKRVKGKPTEGPVSIVITDIEGYSDLMSRCPEIMGKALTMHNNIIRKARWHAFGFTMEQEGDSFTLVFYDAFDAVVFCLAAQQMLNEQEWPEGLAVAMPGSAKRTSKVNGSYHARSSFLQQLTIGLSNKLQARQERLRVGRDSSSLNLSSLHRGPQNSAGSMVNPQTSLEGPEFCNVSVGSRSHSHHMDARSHSTLRDAILNSFSHKARTSNPEKLREREVEGEATNSFSKKLRARLKGRGSPELFNGLRVRMGVASGMLQAGTPLLSSPVVDAAKVVSDAGSGGQVLLDEPTFQRIKDRLFELGAVDCNGMNYKRLRSIKTRKQVKRGLEWLSFEWLYNKTWQGGQSSHDLMEGSPLHPAVVFDMGMYQWCESKLPPIITTTTPSFHFSARSNHQAALLATYASGKSVVGRNDNSNPHGGGPGGMSSLHLFSILPPSLVERAKVWKNKLALKKEWVMVTKPYFDAPGALESPLSAVVGVDPTLPPVTMVFATVEGANNFSAYNRKEARNASDIIVNVFISVMRQLDSRDGYLCRVQGSDLKYMVAFEKPQVALEWCLCVQECLLWQDWSPVVLKYDRFKEEKSKSGKLVFRGPRLKMGVTEGCPRSIHPDHLGRADYYGNNINNAARYMDAAAHGGMIACDIAMVQHVLDIWNGQQSAEDGLGGSSPKSDESFVVQESPAEEEAALKQQRAEVHVPRLRVDTVLSGQLSTPANTPLPDIPPSALPFSFDAPPASQHPSPPPYPQHPDYEHNQSQMETQPSEHSNPLFEVRASASAVRHRPPLPSASCEDSASEPRNWLSRPVPATPRTALRRPRPASSDSNLLHTASSAFPNSTPPDSVPGGPPKNSHRNEAAAVHAQSDHEPGRDSSTSSKEFRSRRKSCSSYPLANGAPSASQTTYSGANGISSGSQAAYSGSEHRWWSSSNMPLPLSEQELATTVSKMASITPEARKQGDPEITSSFPSVLLPPSQQSTLLPRTPAACEPPDQPPIPPSPSPPPRQSTLLPRTPAA
eukprot:CAMPEP_0202400750 /NCGR_PEP_ID=MMETSP1128-20130828/2982_1 /ASSEMBLY_ACC=CAM_ASM_000463 /TAXON_ID=3047 /ORGANISM="Dunaliella tertiolecta, Strain CCMP1320" /LENGTH=1520 /DNA_ID=CAMNT_0049004399 /DNA_START=82 /DNA_END=4641 /DNA_ORIENTATION=-